MYTDSFIKSIAIPMEMNPDLLPIVLPKGTTKFEAGGHTYLVQHTIELSVIRARWLERYSLFSLLGRNAQQWISECRRAYDANNQAKPGDVGVILDNLIRGAQDVMAREDPILYICTLFINRVDEDTKGFDPELAKQKIEDWGSITRSFFLTWALSYLQITDEHLKTLTQISLGSSLPPLDLLSEPPSPTAGSVPSGPR
jgi:hypothetical protein